MMHLSHFRRNRWSRSLVDLGNVEVFFRAKGPLGIVDERSGSDVHGVDHTIAVGTEDVAWPAWYGSGSWVCSGHRCRHRLRCGCGGLRFAACLGLGGCSTMDRQHIRSGAATFAAFVREKHA